MVVPHPRAHVHTQISAWLHHGGTNRKTPTQFMHKMLTKGKHIIPLFTGLGFTVDMVVIGVLHCVDLGVSAEVLGYILWACIQSIGGQNFVNDRTATLLTDNTTYQHNTTNSDQNRHE